jgi:DNA-binding transcriptional LysR family regulator
MFEELFKENGLSLERLHSFYKVAHVKGVTRAAQGNHVIQSLYSRQIKELESFFSIKLVEKGNDGIVLTKDGEDLYHYSNEIFKTLSEFKQRKEKKRKKITIQSGNTFFDGFMIPSMKVLHKKYPQWSFTLQARRTKDCIDNLRSQRTDLVIIRDNEVPRGFKKEKLIFLEYSIFIPQCMVKDSDPDLKDLRFALPELGYSRYRLDEICAKHNIDIKYSLSCRSMLQAKEALQTMHYASILPKNLGFDKKDFIQLNPKWLNEMSHWLSVSWNPKLLAIKPETRFVIESLKELFN